MVRKLDPGNRTLGVSSGRRWMGCAGAPGQHGGHMLTDVDVESAAGFYDRQDRGNAWSGFHMSGVRPVTTANEVMEHIPAHAEPCPRVR